MLKTNVLKKSKNLYLIIVVGVRLWIRIRNLVGECLEVGGNSKSYPRLMNSRPQISLSNRREDGD